MPRFSSKVKKIFDAVLYETNLSKIDNLLTELSDPLDIAYGKHWKAFFSLDFQDRTSFNALLSDIENGNLELKDPILDFHIYRLKFLHNLGWNNPTIDLDKSKKYFKLFDNLFAQLEFVDDWEKYWCTGIYLLTKANFQYSVNQDLDSSVKSREEGAIAFLKIPVDGPYLSSFSKMDLGILYAAQGDFEKSILILGESLKVTREYSNLYQLWSLADLTSIYFLQGKLELAKDWNNEMYSLGQQFQNNRAIYWSLRLKGKILFEEGDYEESETAYKTALDYRKRDNEPLELFWGYFHLFEFYYSQFKITQNRTFLELAENIIDNLETIKVENKEDKTIRNYTNYGNALILRYGNFKKKGKAVSIFEELVIEYPFDFSIALSFLELLFEDVLSSEDEETINQIDLLMENVNKIYYSNLVQTILRFISQQILLAKYNYYIKGDVNKALEILHLSRDKVETYQLQNLLITLDVEISKLENEMRKWNNLDLSVKERIKKSDMNKYVKEALLMSGKQI